MTDIPVKPLQDLGPCGDFLSFSIQRNMSHTAKAWNSNDSILKYRVLSSYSFVKHLVLRGSYI